MKPTRTWIWALALALAVQAQAQVAVDGDGGEPSLEWNWQAAPVDGSGDEVELVLTARIQPGWIIYSSDFEPADFGPRPARLSIDPAAGYAAAGEVRAVGASRKTDRNFAGEYTYTYFSGDAEFRQRVRRTQGAGPVAGTIHGQTCFEASGLCTLFRQQFSASAH